MVLFALVLATQGSAQLRTEQPVTPNMLQSVPDPAARTAGWYIGKAGDQMQAGTFIMMAGALIGGGLIAFGEELYTPGAIVMGAGFLGGIGFIIDGQGKLSTGGYMLKKQGQ